MQNTLHIRRRDTLSFPFEWPGEVVQLVIIMFNTSQCFLFFHIKSGPFDISGDDISNKHHHYPFNVIEIWTKNHRRMGDLIFLVLNYYYDAFVFVFGICLVFLVTCIITNTQKHTFKRACKHGKMFKWIFIHKLNPPFRRSDHEFIICKQKNGQKADTQSCF